MIDAATDRACGERVALVTGGASGIGRSTALKLAAAGLRLAIADLQREAARHVAAEATAAFAAAGHVADGPVAIVCPCDVSEDNDVEHAVRRTLRAFGRLDVAVNSAGTGGALTKLVETRIEDWDRTVAILLRSVFLMTKHAGRAMINGGRGGAIVNVSSTTALAGACAGAAYATAKAGVLTLTKCAAVQLAPHKIRVNAVLPGTIITPLLYRSGRPEDIIPAALATQPWPEAGMPDDVANVIAFLVAEQSRFMTGAEVVVDGGTVAAGPDLYSGSNQLGRAIVDKMVEAGVSGFDHGTVVRYPAATHGHGHDAPPQTAPPSARPRPSEVGVPTSADDDGEGRAGVDVPRRVVLLTGVSRGLGRALAERLIGLGHVVVGCARSAEAVAELRTASPGPHRFDVVDVTDDAAVGAWIGRLVADGLVPDLVLNNAAATHAGRPLWRFEPAEVDRVLTVNVVGPINVIRHVLPPILRRKSGLIVNFSSGWGREAAARTGPYCASKFAIEGLTKAFSLELPPGVAAVTLHPGIIRTESLTKSFGPAAELYPTPEDWAVVAAPYLLGLTPDLNGRALSVPGMTTFRGLGLLPQT